MSGNAVTIRRRSLFAAAPLPLLASMPAARAHAGDEGGQVIAFVTDVHVNPEASPDKTARARATADALVKLDPDLVIHGGDLTEHGSADELRAWTGMFPESFLSRVHHVPGNHEAAWIVDNYAAYRAEIGPLHHSIDLDDLHVVFTNPSIHQQGVADYSPEELSWLREDLAKAKGRPILVVGHHVLALTPNQIRNADKVLDLFTEYGVNAFLCGHIHSERDNVVNGMTELTGVSNGDTPGYYLLTRHRTTDSDLLEVERVDIADPTRPEFEPGRRQLPPIDLAPGDRNRLQPEQASVSIDGDQLQVAVTLRSDVEVALVQAAVMGPTLGSGNVDNYTELTSDGTDWSTTLDLTDVPAGQNRVFIRVTGTPVVANTGGDLWHTTIHFEAPGFTPAWTTRLRGSVTAALVQDGDLVISASTSGHVLAVRNEKRRARRVWTALIGPVHNDPAALADRHQIFLPSADHHVYALDSRTGDLLWRTDLGAPVMSDLATATIDDASVVLALAVDTLFCVDSDSGSILWRQELAGISTGPALCDGEQIYLGLSDGCVWSFDAHTGEPGWSVDQSGGRTDSYRTLIYGPWQGRRAPLPGDAVLAGSTDLLRAVRRSDGEVIWERNEPFGVCPAPRMRGERILAVSEVGRVMMLDPDTGDSDFELDTIPYQKNADFLFRGSEMILTGAGGLVALVDLDARTSRVLGQLAPDYVFSSPALSADESHYIVATMGGELRSYPLP